MRTRCAHVYSQGQSTGGYTLAADEVLWDGALAGRQVNGMVLAGRVVGGGGPVGEANLERVLDLKVAHHGRAWGQQPVESATLEAVCRVSCEAVAGHPAA